jgi:hypothetical protein
MQSVIDQFHANIQSARALGELCKIIQTQTTGVLDLSDLLRAELVMAVSALDHFVHEVVRLGMLEIHHGRRPATESFQRFTITIESVRQALSSPSNDDWLDAEIREKHCWRGFQNSERIAEAIHLISDVRLWEEIGKQLRMPAIDVRRGLDLIVDRRNKIAHEADTDPSFPGRRWPITGVTVEQAVSYIETVVEAMYSLL